MARIAPQLAPLNNPEPARIGSSREESATLSENKRGSVSNATKYMKAPRIVYKGHRGNVISLGVLRSPEYNDTLVLSGSEDKTTKVWSLCSGQFITTLAGHKQRISGALGYCSANCPPVAVTASWDETLRIWPLACCFTDEAQNINPDKLLAQSIQLSGFKNRVLGITAVPLAEEGAGAVAAGSSDNSIQIWRLPTGEKLYVLQDAEDVTWNLCMASWTVTLTAGYSLQGPVVLSGTKNNTVRIWSFFEAAARKEQAIHRGESWEDLSQKPHRVIRGQHTSAVHCIATFDCDAPLVVTICRDYDIRVFNILSGELQRTMRGHQSSITSVTALDISVARGGAIIVSSSTNGNMRVWKYSTGELLRMFNGHTEEIHNVTTFRTPEPGKDDLIIVSGSKDQSLRTWLFAEEKNLRILPHRIGDYQFVKTSDGTKAVNRTPLLKSVRIFALDVYTGDGEEEAIIVTGADSGLLRAYSVSQANNDNTMRWVSQAHEAQVQTLVIFNPQFAPNSNSGSNSELLRMPLVLSGCRDGNIVFTDIHTGAALVQWKAHDSVVTSLCVYGGRNAVVKDGGQGICMPIDPFLVSGSEDNTAKVWRLSDQTLLFHLEGHEFDVSSVAIYCPRSIAETPQLRKDKLRSNVASRAASRAASPRDGAVTSPPSRLRQLSHESAPDITDPIIITGSVDSNICLWSSTSGELLEVLSNAEAFVTTLTVIDPKPTHGKQEPKPLLAAGDGEGRILIWSLHRPYKLLHTFVGHTDEIACLSSYDAEGLYPVLVSGSLDTTIRVWDLRRMVHKSTLEGHTDDVMAVRIFTDGESDAAVASGSVDSTVRVLFDFLGNVPNIDIVKQQFDFDLKGTNAHILGANLASGVPVSSWPRISQMVQREGADNFFGLYFQLFGEALRAGRSDFLTEFLPQTPLGLLKSNSEYEDGDAADGRGGLLTQAMERKDLIAVRAIVTSWCAFLTAGPQSGDSDLLYDPQLGLPRMTDCLRLAELYPKEFEKLICSLRLLPAQYNSIPTGEYCLYEDREKGTMIARYHPHEHKPDERSKLRKKPEASAESAGKVEQYKETSAAAGQQLEGDGPVRGSPLRSSMDMVRGMFEDDAAAAEAEEELRRPQTFLFLPLRGAVHMDMLKAYTDVCSELDSVEIFNSEAGQLALSFAWNTFGIRAHLTKFAIYLFYVAVSCASTLSFEFTRKEYAPITYILIALQLLINLYFVRSEMQQYLTGIIEYLSDIWNFFDFSVILGSTAANILRLVYWKETTASVIVLSFTSIFMWFNILYYLRAFESTGPLVSMILKISSDIEYLILVVLLVLVGFSQAFWLISEGDESTPFSTIDASLLHSFSFMLGGYDPEGFDGVPLRSLALFLSVVYMLIVSILLLNLLIALMGDSYSEVKEKGLAQWKFEQCQIITEMQGSMSDADRNCMDTVYFRLNTEDNFKVMSEEQKAAAANEERQARNEARIEELQRGQEELQRMMREQLEMNQALRELLITNFQRQSSQ